MSTDYCLRVIRVDSLHWKHRLHSKVPDLYVKARVGNVERRTRVVKKCFTPTWNESLIFPSSSLDDSATLRIELKHDSSWNVDPCVGLLEIKLNELLTKSTDGEVTLSLSMNNAGKLPKGLVVLHLKAVDALTGATISLERASEDVGQAGIRRSEGAADVTQAIDSRLTQLSHHGDLYQAVQKLLSRLGMLRQAIDTVSEIHPFLAVAWKLTSALYSAVENAFKTDKRVIDLVHAMGDAFDFARDVHTLSDKAANLHEPLSGLLKQTIECCLFVSQYTSRSFLSRMLDANSNQKIDEFERVLASFKQQIESGVNIHTAFVSTRTAKAIDDLLLRQRLDPDRFGAFDRPVCLPETRLDIRRQIVEWVFSETDRTIFWLHGVAGSGKSTVSTTIAEQFQDMSRLGAFLFFERGKSEPDTVIRTVAYKLALFDSSIGSSILQETENHKDIACASSSQQFTKLLLRPLLNAETFLSGPVLIVLDGLDECGMPQSRRSLMNILLRDFQKLPKCFRFLVSSRREGDIDMALASWSGSVCMMELDYSSSASKQDVHCYLRTEMLDAIDSKVKIPAEWPWDDNLELLSNSAAGLFIWASTAVKMVTTSDNPFRTLQDLVSDSRTVARFGLDELYAAVLRNSGIAWDRNESRARFKQVLSFVLLSKVPLSSDVIDGLLGFPPEETSRLILTKLQCILSFSEGGPVNLFHASFADFLTSPRHSDDPWFIDLLAVRSVVINRCFTVMDDLLRFNLCDLQSSFVRNDDIPGLEVRVKMRIPAHLEYACVHWAQHLADAPYSSELLDILAEFAHRRLIFWFEALSLLKLFASLATRALFYAAEWAKVHSKDITSFLKDAGKLASIFTFPISQSTPHIYVSMIPFTKYESKVSAHYSKQLYSQVHVERRGSKWPPMYLKVLEGHHDAVNSIAFSPDGKLVASASEDGSVRVWDVDSGVEVFPSPSLTGHTLSVRSVGFSSDGNRIVSGSEDGSLYVWDAQSGCLLLGPLKVHSKDVRSVAFSPKDTRIASGSEDRTITIWDAKDGSMHSEPFTGHTDIVSSVAFSPDGSLLVSGSWDNTVRIWNVNSGKSFLPPFEGHDGYVESVAFSPDGEHVASGSVDRTIKIWEVKSGKVQSTFEYTEPITSISYSPCGSRIVVGSWAESFNVLDAGNGQVMSGPFEGHTSKVSCVAFSPDGEYIVSSSDDKTVRIWDATTRPCEPRKRTDGDAISSVALSSDKRLIASGSEDGSIVVWNVQTGSVVGNPFQSSGNRIICLGFSPDGSRLIWISEDGTSGLVTTCNLETAQITSTSLEKFTNGIDTMVLSPDGTLVVSSSSSPGIRVWNVATGKCLAELSHGHEERITALAFSPNGSLLASGSRDKTVKIWRIDTWEVLSEPMARHDGSIYRVCFSRDGGTIISASSDWTVIVWDAMDGHRVAGPFNIPWLYVQSGVVSEGDTYLVALSLRNTVHIWSTVHERGICELGEQMIDIDELTSSSDGLTIVSTSRSDDMLRIWDISDVLEHAREHEVNSATTSSSKLDVSDWYLGDNGWILGGHDRHDLLLWVPPDLRRTLIRPRNTAILNCEFSTRVDFTGAALGERWKDCFAPSE